MNEGYFDGSMPRPVLEYYLSRAATASATEDLPALTGPSIPTFSRMSVSSRTFLPCIIHAFTRFLNLPGGF